MPTTLTPTQFGNPILRKVSKELDDNAILSKDVQTLISDMEHTLKNENYGVGLAAPQVGESVALSVIGIKPTPTRPNLEILNIVLINPKITTFIGETLPMWEACISCGVGENILYAQVPRYEQIELAWVDENCQSHTELFNGFTAHVMQHEVDHLNGILFVDKVVDTTSYMMADEYRKRIRNF